jgi:ligand-binding sensor domain-containing protein/signal transduction histidine kinase
MSVYCRGILWAAVATGTLFAAQLPLRRYTTADGLPSDRISQIVSDQRGFLWFATSEGLSRFDGYKFSNLTTLDGLPYRSVSSILIARDGVFWLATPKGLVRFRPELPASSPERLHVFQATNPPGNSLSTSLSVNYVLEDRAGRIWCATVRGVFMMDPKAASPQLSMIDAGLPGNKKTWDSNVKALAEDSEGAIWLGMYDGTLYRRWPDGRVEHYTSIEGIPSSPLGDPPLEVTDLLRDREGRLWVATLNSFYRLVSHPRPGSSIIEYRPGKREGMPNSRVYSLFESSKGEIWAGTYLWLTKYTCDDCPLQVWNQSEGLPELGVLSVAEDRNGNFWFASTDTGAYKLSNQGIVSYSRESGIQGAGNAISIGESARGALYLIKRASDAGIFVNTQYGDSFTAVRPKVPAGIYNFGWRPSARAILQDHSGEWWVASTYGLLRYPKLDSPVLLSQTLPKALYKESDGLPSREVIRLYESRDGNLWVGTGAKSIAVWNRREERFVAITGEVDERPVSFGEDPEGHVWIGDENGKLWRIEDGRLSFMGGPADSSDWINDILFDHVGRLWVATSTQGLLRFDHPTGPHPKFRKYDGQEGLSSTLIHCMVEDRNGSILLGTGTGIDRLDPDSGRIKHYVTPEGIAGGEIDSAYRSKDGSIWFGARYGLTRIAPTAPLPEPRPLVWMTGVSIGGRPAPVSEIGEAGIRGLEIPPNQQGLEFDFVSPSYASGDPPRYQYRINSGAWSEPITSRSLHYGSLASGRYRLEVRAVNADGEGSPEPAVAEFLVIPPIWQRWWFLGIAASMLAGAMLWAHRLRINKLLELERVRMGIATDLHDDIGSSLSRIAILSEVAQRGQSETGETLEKIGGLARELIDSTGDIVWAVHPHRDHLSDLKRRMRHFATDILSARNISLIWKTPETGQDFELSSNLRRQVYLIFKESVNNISRHSSATQAVVQLTTSSGELMLEISDNGRGFDLSRATYGNGLKSMQARATQLAGSFDLHSHEGGGTSVLLRVPLPE